MSRLKEQYENEIKDAMIKKFGYKNTMEVPKLDKIVVNMGVGEAKENAKLLEAAAIMQHLVSCFNFGSNTVIFVFADKIT